jgi:hypothetical protein
MTATFWAMPLGQVLIGLAVAAVLGIGATLSRLMLKAVGRLNTVDEIKRALVTPEATQLEPRPTPGLIDTVAVLGDRVTHAVEVANSNGKRVERLQRDVRELKATTKTVEKKITPNGGGTDEPGDLLLAVAQTVGARDLPTKPAKKAQATKRAAVAKKAPSRSRPRA